MTKIYVDMRESRSQVLSLLRSTEGLEIEVCELSSGDYVLREDTVVERKAAIDFVASIMDQRLFNQVAKMKVEYARPLILIEGDIFKTRSAISPQSLAGALSYLTAIEGIPVVTVQTAQETAGLLATMARHLQEGLGYEVPLRAGKPKPSLDMAQYLVEGLPGVGPKTARTLLGHFGSSLSVFTASAAQLCEVPGIGKKTADRVVEALTWRLEP